MVVFQFNEDDIIFISDCFDKWLDKQVDDRSRKSVKINMIRNYQYLMGFIPTNNRPFKSAVSDNAMMDSRTRGSTFGKDWISWFNSDNKTYNEKLMFILGNINSPLFLTSDLKILEPARNKFDHKETSKGGKYSMKRNKWVSTGKKTTLKNGSTPTLFSNACYPPSDLRIKRMVKGTDGSMHAKYVKQGAKVA